MRHINKTRLCGSILAAVFAVGMLPAQAFLEIDEDDETEIDPNTHQGTSSASVNADSASFKVVVPTKLPFAILKDGEVLTASNATVKNQSKGPVVLDGITAEGMGWAFADYDTVDFNKMPMNSKVLTMKLNEDKVPAGTANTVVDVPLTTGSWASGPEGSIYGESELTVSYNGKFAPQADASEEAVIAHVVFSLSWDTSEESEDSDKLLARPRGTNIFTYDGAVKTPAWTGYNSKTMRMAGDTMGVNAGKYTVTIEPKDDYTWDDGSTDVITYDWEIQRAETSFSIQQRFFQYDRQPHAVIATPETGCYIKQNDSVTEPGDGTGSDKNGITIIAVDNNHRWSSDIVSALAITDKTADIEMAAHVYPETGEPYAGTTQIVWNQSLVDMGKVHDPNTLLLDLGDFEVCSEYGGTVMENSPASNELGKHFSYYYRKDGKPFAINFPGEDKLGTDLRYLDRGPAWINNGYEMFIWELVPDTLPFTLETEQVITYDGDAHFPDGIEELLSETNEYAGFDLSGTLEKQSAKGTYTTTITPKYGFCWDNNPRSTAPVTITWTIK